MDIDWAFRREEEGRRFILVQKILSTASENKESLEVGTGLCFLGLNELLI